MVDQYHLQPGTASILIFCLGSHLSKAFLYHTINEHPNPWQHPKAFQWMRDPKLLTKKGALMDSMKPTDEDLQNTGKQVCRRKLISPCRHPYFAPVALDPLEPPFSACVHASDPTHMRDSHRNMGISWDKDRRISRSWYCFTFTIQPTKRPPCGVKREALCACCSCCAWCCCLLTSFVHMTRHFMSS